MANFLDQSNWRKTGKRKIGKNKTQVGSKTGKKDQEAIQVLSVQFYKLECRKTVGVL